MMLRKDWFVMTHYIKELDEEQNDTQSFDYTVPDVWSNN